MSKNDKNDKKDLNVAIEQYLDETKNNNSEMDCDSGVCILKGDKSILERINKKIISEDGRQLLI